MTHSKKFIKLCTKYGVGPDNLPNEVLSFEDACEITGDDPTKLPIVKSIAKRHQKRIVRDYQLSIIAEAIKDNRRPDYTDTNEYKRFPVFRVKADKKRPSGFGLSYHDYDYGLSTSSVGVRLCFPNWDMQKFFAEHFLKMHIDHQLYT
jgi:hypothetical protein